VGLGGVAGVVTVIVVVEASSVTSSMLVIVEAGSVTSSMLVIVDVGAVTETIYSNQCMVLDEIMLNNPNTYQLKPTSL
jgi:hypothetical protein